MGQLDRHVSGFELIITLQNHCYSNNPLQQAAPLVLSVTWVQVMTLQYISDTRVFLCVLLTEQE